MNGNQHQKSGSRLGVVVAVAVIVSLAVSIIVGVLRQWSGFQNRAATNSVQVAVSAKDRVLKRGVIRAGYAIYPPASFKDPNTGKISGICVDVLEEAAKNLGLKVEWTEEVPWVSPAPESPVAIYTLGSSPGFLPMNANPSTLSMTCPDHRNSGSLTPGKCLRPQVVRRANRFSMSSSCPVL